MAALQQAAPPPPTHPTQAPRCQPAQSRKQEAVLAGPRPPVLLHSGWELGCNKTNLLAKLSRHFGEGESTRSSLVAMGMFLHQPQEEKKFTVARAAQLTDLLPEVCTPAREALGAPGTFPGPSAQGESPVPPAGMALSQAASCPGPTPASMSPLSPSAHPTAVIVPGQAAGLRPGLPGAGGAQDLHQQDPTTLALFWQKPDSPARRGRAGARGLRGGLGLPGAEPCQRPTCWGQRKEGGQGGSLSAKLETVRLEMHKFTPFSNAHPPSLLGPATGHVSTRRSPAPTRTPPGAHQHCAGLVQAPSLLRAPHPLVGALPPAHQTPRGFSPAPSCSERPAREAMHAALLRASQRPGQGPPLAALAGPDHAWGPAAKGEGVDETIHRRS